jgi:hypothetical protein
MLSPPWTADLAHPDPTKADHVGLKYALDYSVQVVRGATAIQAAGPDIAELRRRTGQDENPLLCLDFFLGRVRLFPGNDPVVLLAHAAGRLEGAVYLYEKLFGGMHTGYFRGFDHLTGESAVIADERARVSLLQVAIQQLLRALPGRPYARVRAKAMPCRPRSMGSFCVPKSAASVANIGLN